MKIPRHIRWTLFLLHLGVVALSLWAYPRLPESMAVHWNLAGEPDRWVPRWVGVGWGLLVVFGMSGLYFGLVPRMEPWRENLARFWTAYVHFGVAMLAFLAGVYAFTLLWNLGYPLDIRRVLGLGLGFLFLATARVLQQARPNWFLGIRTPWTLSSPWVWRRVHDRAAQTLVFLAGVYLLAVFWPGLLLVALALTLAWAVGISLYSYLLYRARVQEDAL